LKFSAQVAAFAMEEGLLARPLPVNDIVGISPPLMLTRGDADQVAEMLQRAITRASAMLSTEQRRGTA
jgi:adenosylmethionine-8-amino-7-oxononanoate aminotransferase